MVKTIAYLKAVVTDGMILKGFKGNDVVIRRFPNNIIMLHGRSISWKDFQELLANSEYQLQIQEFHQDLGFDNKSKSKAGGVRLGAGRKKKADKKIVKSFSLSPKAIETLKCTIQKNYQPGEISYSEYIEMLIMKFSMQEV